MLNQQSILESPCEEPNSESTRSSLTTNRKLNGKALALASLWMLLLATDLALSRSALCLSFDFRGRPFACEMERISKAQSPRSNRKNRKIKQGSPHQVVQHAHLKKRLCMGSESANGLCSELSSGWNSMWPSVEIHQLS